MNKFKIVFLDVGKEESYTNSVMMFIHTVMLPENKDLADKLHVTVHVSDFGNLSDREVDVFSGIQIRLGEKKNLLQMKNLVIDSQNVHNHISFEIIGNSYTSTLRFGREKLNNDVSILPECL